LEYLVRDVARRHGQVRVGAASSYLRSDDPATLTELLALPRLSGLGWRRLAPTVVAAPSDPGRTMELLRMA
ncbi:MAG: helicase-associated domain-containing protein, partial [Micrococcus sp.]|nr:helicase-associated domain-containing protein [Micrococcus sp.]